MAASKFTPERFAEVYNDTARFPDLAAVAAELGVGYQTVRNYATMYRRRRGEGETVPELTSRKSPAPVADGTSRTIETQLPAYEEPIEDLIKRATEHNARYAQHHEAKAIIDVAVKFPGPYGVVGLPDHHLNNYKGNSRFNSMHAIMVHILERWQGEDVIWGGHIHQAGHASLEKQWLGHSRVVHGVQLGAYKQIDGYARREHFRPNVPFLTPVTIHDPASGRTIFFDDVREGVRYLDLLRGEGRAAA